jgi:hypothetical protein
MALNEVATRSSVSYLTIAEGKLCMRSKEAREGYTTRMTKTGKEVHERYFESLDGIVTDVHAKDTEYGRKWVIELKDGSDTYVLQMNYDSSYAKYILNSLLNTTHYSLARPVNIKPYYFEDKSSGKLRKGVTVSQDANKIPWKFGVGELPPMVQIVVKGEKIWDDTDQLARLQAEVDYFRSVNFLSAHPAGALDSF